MATNRLGIVGSGLTGVVTAMLLKEKLPYLNVMILEKSRGTGGRMCTSRSSKGIPVDLGAQFITKTKNLSEIQEKCYKQLIQAGVLKPLCETIEGLNSQSSTVGNFVCPKGSGSLIKYFLSKSGCETLFNHRVNKVNLINNKWIMQCDNGSHHEFEAIVLTLPVPQILELEGIENYLKNYLPKLKAVEYSSRFALGLFYDQSFEYFKSLPFCAKFISDDSVIRYISFDNYKRNDKTEPTSIAIHTTKEFGKSHINTNPTVVEKEILNQFTKLFPEIPEATEIKFHKWRYSQVLNNFGEQKSLILTEQPALICGGDGFTHSTFEGCILSAEDIAKSIIKLFI